MTEECKQILLEGVLAIESLGENIPDHKPLRDFFLKAMQFLGMDKKCQVENVLITTDDIKNAADDRLWHYNGGWFKTVKGIDKSVTTGYSIIGEFFGSGGDIRRVPYGSTMLPVGALILDCSIGGSRKNQRKTYYLLKVKGEHELELIKSVDSKNWATDLWPYIEKNL